MELLAKLAAWSMLAFSVLLFLSQVLAREMGYWLGQRHRAARGTKPKQRVLDWWLVACSACSPSC